jgi:hypothetical protein
MSECDHVMVFCHILDKEKIKQSINLKFLVKLETDCSLQSGKEEAIDALKNTHFTENEKSKNEQVASEGNDDRFLQYQRHTHD